MTARRALYLRILVSAFTAESRTLNSDGDRREPKHLCGECASLGENSISGGYDIITAKDRSMGVPAFERKRQHKKSREKRIR